MCLGGAMRFDKENSALNIKGDDNGNKQAIKCHHAPKWDDEIGARNKPGHQKAKNWQHKITSRHNDDSNEATNCCKHGFLHIFSPLIKL